MKESLIKEKQFYSYCYWIKEVTIIPGIKIENESRFIDERQTRVFVIVDGSNLDYVRLEGSGRNTFITKFKSQSHMSTDDYLLDLGQALDEACYIHQVTGCSGQNCGWNQPKKVWLKDWKLETK